MEFCWNTRLPATSTAAQHRKRPKAGKITLNNIHEHFCYLQRYQVLICKEHATGLQNIDVHLRDQHNVVSKERKAIVEHCSRWQIAAWQDVELPVPMGLPIEELGKPLDVYQCNIADNCGFCTANKIRMQKHCNNVHQMAWKSNEATLCRKVKAQTFFRAGGQQRYFVVRAADSTSTLSIPLKVADVIKERLAEWQLTQHAYKERAQVMDAQVAKTDKTGWFKRTGWLEHFANRNLMHLAHQIRLPIPGR
jgi:hypothetical protein